jgi:hypothetical protein
MSYLIKEKQQPAAACDDHQKQQGMEVDDGNDGIKLEPEEEDEAEKEDEEGDDDAEKQPPMKVARNRRGQKREYNFLQSVNSMEELNNFRLKVI